MNTSRNTVSLANTKIADLEHLKNTQPISAKHTHELFSSLQKITLVTDGNLKLIQVESLFSTLINLSENEKDTIVLQKMFL